MEDRCLKKNVMSLPCMAQEEEDICRFAGVERKSMTPAQLANFLRVCGNVVVIFVMSLSDPVSLSAAVSLYLVLLTDMRVLDHVCLALFL